jgi:outer membrane murein-binding lipoprotein Lpp
LRQAKQPGEWPEGSFDFLAAKIDALREEVDDLKEQVAALRERASRAD